MATAVSSQPRCCVPKLSRRQRAVILCLAGAQVGRNYYACCSPVWEVFRPEQFAFRAVLEGERCDFQTGHTKAGKAVSAQWPPIV